HLYDKSNKWLIQHHGDSILRLAGVLDIVSWQPLPAELVQSRRLPDGLIEVRRNGQAEPDLYVLEIATYPEARVADQVVDDTALVYLDRRVVPEVLVLFLHPKGNIEAAGAVNLRSRQGWTDWRLSWRIAKLWEIPAEELLAASDVGLIPWVPLTQFLSGQAGGASAEPRLGHGSKSLPSQVTIAGAGVEVAIASEPQRGGLGSGRVARRASTPATLSCNPLLNHALFRHGSSTGHSNS